MRISERECERMWICIWVSVRVMAFSSLSLSIVRRCCVRMNVCVCEYCVRVSEMKRNLAVIKRTARIAQAITEMYTQCCGVRTRIRSRALVPIWLEPWPVFPVFHKISSGSLRNIYMWVCVCWPSISFRVNFPWLCFNWIISRTENDVQIVFNFNLWIGIVNLKYKIMNNITH